MRLTTPLKPGARSAASRADGGFTLVETLIAATVLAIAVVALVTPLSLSAEKQREAALQTTAAALASQMMELMLTLDAEAVLAADGLEQTGGDITDSQGRPLNDPSLAGFTIAVEADSVAIPIGSETFEEAADFVSLRVTVTHPDVLPVTLTRLIAP